MIIVVCILCVVVVFLCCALYFLSKYCMKLSDKLDGLVHSVTSLSASYISREEENAQLKRQNDLIQQGIENLINYDPYKALHPDEDIK